MMLCPATGDDCDVQGCVGGGLCKRRREQQPEQPAITRKPPIGALAKTREARLEDCLNFFASVIKSGEPWTDTCEAQFRAAKAK